MSFPRRSLFPEGWNPYILHVMGATHGDGTDGRTVSARAATSHRSPYAAQFDPDILTPN